MKKTGFTFTDDNPAGFVVKIPAEILSKSMLLTALGSGLRFPDYYGTNWDALEECIRDLSWLPDHEIILYHVDLPLIDDPAAVKIYLSVLMDAIHKWSSESTHRLKVYFPSRIQTEVEKLVAEATSPDDMS